MFLHPDNRYITKILKLLRVQILIPNMKNLENDSNKLDFKYNIKTNNVDEIINLRKTFSIKFDITS
jgi:hypothetical protein